MSNVVGNGSQSTRYPKLTMGQKPPDEDRDADGAQTACAGVEDGAEVAAEDGTEDGTEAED